VTEKIGHDIRMAGIGLPGNGVQMALYDTSSDQLEIFLNETKSQTKLATNLSFYDVKILVVDCSKAVSDGWVCIASNGLDTLYRKVSSIGNCTVSGPDTIHLSGIVAAGVFTVAATDIYFCKRIMYRVQKSGSVVNLVVQRNQIAVNLGENLDTLNIEPQNSTGTVLTSSFENTATIVIFAGGYVGTGLNRNLISESTQINIRNRD
jgi:hypothetical protein